MIGTVQSLDHCLHGFWLSALKIFNSWPWKLQYCKNNPIPKNLNWAGRLFIGLIKKSNEYLALSLTVWRFAFVVTELSNELLSKCHELLVYNTVSFLFFAFMHCNQHFVHERRALPINLSLTLEAQLHHTMTSSADQMTSMMAADDGSSIDDDCSRRYCHSVRPADRCLIGCCKRRFCCDWQVGGSIISFRYQPLADIRDQSKIL